MHNEKRLGIPAQPFILCKRSVSLSVKRLLCFGWNNAYGATVQTTFAELNSTIYKSVQSVVLTLGYVQTRIVTGTALANDDVAGDALFSTENLNT